MSNPAASQACTRLNPPNLVPHAARSAAQRAVRAIVAFRRASPHAVQANAPAPHRHSVPARRRDGGFTLVELMIAVTVVGILSGIAYPSFMQQVSKMRRSDALVAVMQVQWAQERWRAGHASYGSLQDIGVRDRTTAGHYTLAIGSRSADGYDVTAVATGAQSNDTQCRHLRLTSSGAQLAYASGAGPELGNDEGTNRRCWML